VRSSLIAARAFFVSFIPLLLFGIVIWKSPALAVAQVLVSNDVTHDTPGQVIKQGQFVHIDVDLAEKFKYLLRSTMQRFSKPPPTRMGLTDYASVRPAPICVRLL
jgi:hypothetical protein